MRGSLSVGENVKDILFSNIVQLMNYIGFATWFSIGAAVACIPYLRWKHPELERPIKGNLVFPFTFIPFPQL